MSFPFEEHHGWMVGNLFTLKADTDNKYTPKLAAGTLVKVVMVSRFGDCGITTNLQAEHGYSNRVMPFDLVPLPDAIYDMKTPEVPDLYKRLGRSAATQLTIAEIEKMAAKGEW